MHLRGTAQVALPLGRLLREDVAQESLPALDATTALGALALGPLGGALAGVAATLAAVILYVFIFGNPDRLGYFLRESGVVVLVLGLPAMLTGSLTALIVRKGSRQ